SVRLDKVNGIADGLDFFGSIVRDFDVEFLFERHYQLDRVEGVSAQIINKAGGFGYFTFINAQMLNDDLLHAFGNITHGYSYSSLGYILQPGDHNHSFCRWQVIYSTPVKG